MSFTLDEGERVGLIGPNGAGKSTLLKIVAGAITADRGEVMRRSALRVAYVEQVPALLAGDGSGSRDCGTRRARTGDGTEGEARVSEWLNKLELEPEARVDRLSGGWQKRVAFGRALVSEPELLLLDEPTNHLDVESILWLERLLANAPFATLTVTHDRLFLQRVSTRILELSPRNEGGLLNVCGRLRDLRRAKSRGDGRAGAPRREAQETPYAAKRNGYGAEPQRVRPSSERASSAPARSQTR